MEEKYFPDEPDYEYWLICPKCKKSIPIINLFIVKEKEVVNDSSGIVKDVDTLYADIKCKNCEPMSIPLKTYFEFIKKNFKMMKPEKIDIKFKNKDFEEGDEKIIYCMDQHGYLDYKHYLMHNVVKFKFNHILCEKELNIDSYCGLNEKHDYYKKGKYFCQLCNLPLCNACYEHHKTNFKAHPISKLENENSLVEKIYNKFIEIQLRDEYKNLEINKLILEYISLLKKNFDRIAVNHIPNYYLLQNFKLLQIRENEGEYLINSNAFSLNYNYENIKKIDEKINILRIDDINDNYSFLTFGYKKSYLYNYNEDLFEIKEIPCLSGEKKNGIIFKYKNERDDVYLIINNYVKEKNNLLIINLKKKSQEKTNVNIATFFNTPSLDNMFGGFHDGKIKLCRFKAEKEKKIKTKCSIEIRDAKIKNAVFINKLPFKLLSKFEILKTINLNNEEEIDAIIVATDKNFIEIVNLKRTTKKNKLSFDLEIISKLNINNINNKNNIINCLCDIEKGFCFSTEENNNGYLYIYNENEVSGDVCDNKILTGNSILCMCKTQNKNILVTGDKNNEIKFWDLKYITCIYLFQIKEISKEPDITKILFVNNRNKEEKKKNYDLIVVLKKEIIIYRSTIMKKFDTNSDSDSEEEIYAYE